MVRARAPAAHCGLLSAAAERARPARRWEERELRQLCATMGLQDFKRHRNLRFILFSARKAA